ncbi:MAG: hypothetical protein HY690_17685 [Chloroflexi bacterium]|nr:hypothetical protein [Chloroflexota bacterium]
MSRKRVLLLSNGSLLTASVLRLLEGVEELELELLAADDPEASARIDHFAPQVIVLDAGGPPVGRELVARMLLALPRTRVIALNLERADMEVYRAQRVSGASLHTLLEAIHGKRKGSQSRATEQPEEGVARGGEQATTRLQG